MIPTVISKRAALAGALALTLIACRKTETNGVDRQAGGAGKPPVAVALTPAAAANLVDSVDVVGSLAPKFTADVKSEVTGTVAAVYVTEWVSVRKGTRLARLETSETEAGIEALAAVEAQARVGEARARREWERAQQLKQYGLITAQALDDALTAREAAEAAVAAAAAQVRTARAHLAKSSITAPMDGVVANRSVSPGDRVENMGSSVPMFRIVDNRLLNLTVTVPTSRLPDVRIGERLEFTTDAVPGRTYVGKVMFINPSIDEASRSAKIIAEVPNADGSLAGGLFVKGRIVVAARAGVVQVPRAALINWNVGGKSAEVFTVRNGRAEKRTVQVGVTAGESVEVVQGLAAGEPVVTRGAFALKPGDAVVVAANEAA